MKSETIKYILHLKSGKLAMKTGEQGVWDLTPFLARL